MVEMHSTNYQGTLILISPDSKAIAGCVPPKPESIAGRQYRVIIDSPYQLSSDDVVFGVFADRQNIGEALRAEARKVFFSKGQPCLRSSALVKTYGWGVHFDTRGFVALVGRETEEYQHLLSDDGVKKIEGMRSKRT